MDITSVRIIPLPGSDKCIVRVSRRKDGFLDAYLTNTGKITHDKFCRHGQIIHNRELNRKITFTNIVEAEKKIGNLTKWEEETKPQPDSMWLVVVEGRYEVIQVSYDGNGFFIPGQEPCWVLSHVDKWIKEIVPSEWDTN